MEKTVSTLYLRALFDYLKGQSLDASALQAWYRPGSSAMADGERIEARRYQSVLLQAVELSGDDLLGLHVGEHIKPGYYGALGYVAMCCENLGQALQKHLRYQKLVSDHGLVTLTQADDKIMLQWHAQMENVDRHVVENIFSAWVCFGRWICGLPLCPSAVLFQHDSHASAGEYQRVFGCPVQFRQATSALVLPSSYLAYPLVQADGEVLGQFERQAKQLIQRMNGDGDVFVQELTVFMARTLPLGTLCLDSAARHCRMSARALQRNLAQRSLQFRDLVDHTRQDLARQYISNTAISLADLAFLLDFADQASFQRAFKRWFGVSPGQWRQQCVPRS